MEAETAKKKAAPKKIIAYAPPEIIARAATPDETPGVAVSLRKLADRNGWDVTVTYARGTTHTTQPRLVHSIAVRMRRGHQRAVAVWTAPVGPLKLSWKFELGARLGRWKCLFSLQEGVLPIKLGNAALRAYVASDLPVCPQELPVDIWAPTQTSVDVMAVAGDVMGLFLIDS